MSSLFSSPGRTSLQVLQSTAGRGLGAACSPAGMVVRCTLLLGLVCTLVGDASAQRIVFVSGRDGNPELYVMNGDGSGQTRLTNNPGNDRDPQWSPDGSEILFNSDRDGDWDIYVMNADGSGQTNLTKNSLTDIGGRWSPDGAKILFFSDRGGSQLYVMNADGSSEVNASKLSDYVYEAVWSPDSARIAFFGDENNARTGYIVTADGAVRSKLEAAVGPSARLPDWSPDGTKIVFEGGAGSLVVADADGSTIGQLSDGQGCCNSNPSWSPDGSRFLYVAYYDFPYGQIGVVKVDGTQQWAFGEVDTPHGVQWSPDGTRVLYDTWLNGSREIFVAYADGSGTLNVSASPAHDHDPFWSPDGSRVFFKSDRAGHDELYVVNPDGASLRNLTNSGASNSSFQAFGDFSVGLPPAISDGGVVMANLLPAVHTIAPLSIVSVFGTGFSLGSVYYPTQDASGKVASNLGGSCVEVNGARAPILAMLPNQANIQAPTDLPLGPVTVTVIRNCDSAEAIQSDAVLVTVEQASPAFFLYSPYASDGNIAARFNDGFAAVASAGAIADQQGASRPARPGESISLFGTGWGQTKVPLAAGEIANVGNSLIDGAGLTVTFDGVPLDPDEGIEYAGTAPSSVGVYQLAIRVPANAQPGNHQIGITIHGKSSPAGPVIPVAAP